ncbi:hypothetical protein COY32_01660 [candidate division WWE3 bacterium CG_4_10_14_0_2_um_filter_41_14]|uniref:Uncharacterized protein n=1 Tax=candidate division WWE3 bacterium CG_4_10_14_0_2_um_filter_41_14 TaxID=1975072 RepID=A0A2M7TKW2_UNCKA|nr:MAG: hypothetical protein COY32_01660 [candidate division WWE3 bacterium CG_4_10_14_0_2_um_filter_41_14]
MKQQTTKSDIFVVLGVFIVLAIMAIALNADSKTNQRTVEIVPSGTTATFMNNMHYYYAHSGPDLVRVSHEVYTTINDEQLIGCQLTLKQHGNLLQVADQIVAQDCSNRNPNADKSP